MDLTTLSCGTATREAVAEFRDTHDHPNYDEALQAMLGEVER